ncbi:MAG: DinB family protein [Vicinamibacterales bacterium]
MREPADVIREHLVRVLEWEDAHVSFDRAVAELSPPARGVRPPGFGYSVWELLEHIRLAQADILDFCVNAGYAHTMAWPEDYWPREPAPPTESAWPESIAAYARDREQLKRLAREVEDLTALVPTGTGAQTYLRALLLTADHTAYHVGQIVSVRRALGAWK